MEPGTSSYILIESCAGIALLLPFLSCLVAIAIPKRYAWIVTFSAPMLSLASMITAVVVFFGLFNHRVDFVVSIPWFTVGQYHFYAGIALGRFGVIMLPVVTTISFLVHLYSTGYMAGDKNLSRYFAMLGFFTFSMLGIIMADNLFLIFIFWELVGFSSYMLIGHWMEKPTAAHAATKAFIVNRIGDAGFLIGVLIILTHTGSLSLTDLLNHSEVYSWQTTASLCVFCGVVGKSAQFPLLTWLPDAMEGPTPVSALIHAATMVAAGVYLLARVFFLFTPAALDTVIIIGCATALMASLSALVQTDLKKILAYSTISQLGFMVMAIGSGSESAAMMHLLAHAFFKAGLFLGAGAIIHALHQLERQTHHHFDVQDIRNLGGLRKHLPITCLTFIVCGAALSGIPMFSGLLSKDTILTSVWVWKGSAFSWKWIVAGIAFSMPFLTMIYTFRMVWFVFFGENRTKKIVGRQISISEVPIVMRLPLILLSIGSLWFIVSLNPIHYSGWLYSYLQTSNESYFPFITVFSVFEVLGGLVFAYLYFRNRTIETYHGTIGQWLLQSFYLDRVYETIVVNPVQKISKFTQKIDLTWIDGFIHVGVFVQVTVAHVTGWIDRFVIDGTVNGVARLAGGIGTFTRSFQGGRVQLYIFWSVLGIIIFLISILI